MHKVYARINQDNRVIKIFSDWFNEPLDTDLLVAEGEGDEVVHVQGLYKLYDQNGCHNYKIEDGTLVKCTQEEKQIELKKINSINVCSIKQNKIQESKVLLAKWLEENPLASSVHGESGLYTVTEEKQSLLTQNIILAQLKQANTTTWNCQGGVCEEWTVQELSQLALEIEAYVRPRIKKQQTYEVQVNACTTVEEVEAIEIEYATV